MEDPEPLEAAPEVRIAAGFTMTPHYVYDLGASARAAWHALQTFALGAGECWPRVATLAERAGVSEATIHRGIRKLRDAGAIDVHARISPFGARRSNLYVLHMEPPGKRSYRGVTSDRGEGVTRDTGGVSPMTPRSRENGSRRTETDVSVAKAARDALWEELARVVGWRPDAGDRTAETRFGRAVNAFAATGADAAELRRRAGNYRALFPTVALTPEALVKHWSACGEDADERARREILEASRRRA